MHHPEMLPSQLQDPKPPKKLEIPKIPIQLQQRLLNPRNPRIQQLHQQLL
jgi:hypothetical protein